jgi:quercetin dioxygenase-like cupin family protein
VKRWDLSSLPPSTEKQTPREPGSDAPRVPRRDGQIPRVLFSAPECRVVVIELAAGEAMGEHHVRERAVVHVHHGRVSVEASGESVECGGGSVVTFDPGERHAVRALEDSMLVLVLAPWPAAQHYVEGTVAVQHVPANASVEPMGTRSGEG